MQNEELLVQIQEFIIESKLKLQDILKNFFDIRYMRINRGEIIVDFQDTLAELMYKISSYYNDLCRISKGSKEDSMVKNCQYELRMLISQLKAIGDGYAWIFYHKNREALREHLKHEDNGLFPIRNGGLGEIEFIKSNKILEGCYVLYHSITNILRNGDFSLITAEGYLAGIGEIKTKQIENKLVIDAYTTHRMIPSEKAESIELNDERIWEHLKKQLQSHENILDIQKIEIVREENLKYVYKLIEESAKKEKPVISEDCSMLVYVIDTESKNAEIIYTPDIIANKVTDMLPQILSDKFERNEIIQSQLMLDARMWEMPLLWWSFPEEILTNIVLGKWLVFTWFNKDFLLAELKRKGFGIQRAKKCTSVYKQVDNKEIRISDLSIYVQMATINFVEVKSIVSVIENITNDTKIKSDLNE